jgi:hypothetical protein
MMTINKAQKGKVISKKKKASHPNDAYKNMVNPETGKKGQMGGEGTTPPFSNPAQDLRPYKKLDPKTSAKNGKSFPDLNKDGKVTKADILKGRGVIAQKGKTIKKSLSPAVKQKTGMDGLKDLGKYISTGGLATEKYNPAPSKQARKKMQAGGVVKSTKRVGPVDPKGAYTKVQKRTLAGAKTKASSAKNKQLGATKMAKGGACMSKKK